MGLSLLILTCYFRASKHELHCVIILWGRTIYKNYLTWVFIKDQIRIQISCSPWVILTPIWTNRPRRFGHKNLLEASGAFSGQPIKVKPHKTLFTSWALCCLLFMMPNYGFLIHGVNTSIFFLASLFQSVMFCRQVLSHLLLTVTMICPRELLLPWNMRK